MTPAWSGAAQWRTLSVGIDNSAHFLHLWQAWRSDPQRPRMLHVVAVCGHGFQNQCDEADLKPLAEQLDAQLWGLLPGFHRLVFEGSQVLLTVCVGELQTLLKQQQFEADSVLLNTSAVPGADALYAIKAIARLCRRGSIFVATHSDSALQAALKQCGFDAKKPDDLQATYNPAWTSKKLQQTRDITPTTCVVLGAGLAGAAVASSLARRGWAVTVLDAASQSASGASSLPAGLLVPHTSPDDSPLSRLSRAGVRITLQQARAVLRHGTDWGHTGVLQRDLKGDSLNLPPAWAPDQSQAASDWCYSASPRTLAAAGLPPDSPALWHVQAGWVKPAALVRDWLGTPGVAWRGDVHVAQLKPSSQPGGLWQLLDAAGNLLASANLVVLAAGYASQALAVAAGAAPPDLQAIRGQVTCGLASGATPMPPFPINGNGGLIPNIPSLATLDSPRWLMGASYERDAQQPTLKQQDHADNLARLQTLLPQAAGALADQFKGEQAQGWAGIRCATPNRLPLVMPLHTADATGPVWLCTGMGSRGLSFAALCAELLAAQLHGEPLPIEQRLAQSLVAAKPSLQK